MAKFDPLSTIIEKRAMAIAAFIYDSYRRCGKTDPKYPNERIFIKKNWERFIPKATEQLIEKLGIASTPEDEKMEIYQALTERANHKPTINGREISVLEH